MSILGKHAHQHKPVLDIVCHFYALKVTELITCKLRMNTIALLIAIVTIRSVVGQNTCPVDDDGFYKELLLSWLQ